MTGGVGVGEQEQVCTQEQGCVGSDGDDVGGGGDAGHDLVTCFRW